MSRLSKNLVVATAIAVTQLALPTTDAQAGPFLDWLLGRHAGTYPAATTVAYCPTPTVTAAYPTTCPGPNTTGYPALLAGSYAGHQVAYAAPNLVMQPVQPAQLTQPVVVGYAPSYRTSWFRVPVTYYRPVTAFSGVGGPPVTVMQPCNTQTWQVRRTPWLFRYRPWLPVTAPVTFGAASPIVAAQPIVASPCPCIPTTTASLPYLPSATMATVPGAVVGSGVAPNSVVPGYSVPPQLPSSGSVPADQQPALPLDSIPTTVPNSASTALPQAAATSANTQGVTPNTASSVYQVKPIPDPENKNTNDNSNSPRGLAPPLLIPRERTASQASFRVPPITQAVWKTPATAAPVAAPSSQSAAKSQLWNDTGWRSAKSW